VGDETREVESHSSKRAERGWHTALGVLLTLAVWRVPSLGDPFGLLHLILLAAAVAIIGRFVPWGARTVLLSTAALAVLLVVMDVRNTDRLGQRLPVVWLATADVVICGLTAAVWFGVLAAAGRRSVGQ
jgi:peptidoglycan/LPS O-acetylase OafA/YrhL